MRESETGLDRPAIGELIAARNTVDVVISFSRRDLEGNRLFDYHSTSESFGFVQLSFSRVETEPNWSSFNSPRWVDPPLETRVFLLTALTSWIDLLRVVETGSEVPWFRWNCSSYLRKSNSSVVLSSINCAFVSTKERKKLSSRVFIGTNLYWRMFSRDNSSSAINPSDICVE